jgi:putative flippase GtrA
MMGTLRERLEWVLSHPLIKKGIKLSKFLAAGLPSFGLALPLNWVFVRHLGWDESVAYALVLIMQVTVNFFMCRLFVFTDRKETPAWVQFWQFLGGILVFRLADWAVYSLAVKVCGFDFLAVQVANIFIFAILKFNFSKKILEK